MGTSSGKMASSADYTLLPLTIPPPCSQRRITRTLNVYKLLTLVGVAVSCVYLFHNWHCVSNRQHVGHTRNPAYLIHAKHGAVASENKRCSDIGVKVLKDGGNAVDAVIAATFCTGVVNMFSSGIGGGGFMTVRIPPTNATASSEVYTIDFRETAPALANTTMYKSNPLSAAYGGLAVGVPGEVRGLDEAHRRWGSLPWKTLIEPSISLAAGWEVDKELGRRIPWYPDLMLKNPDWSAIFAPDGRFLKEGEKICRTNLSRTLTTIAEEGADAFYTGPIAESIVRKARLTGGILSEEDLANYTVKVERALEGKYHGKRIYTTHAPTSGAVLIHMLNLMESFDLKERSAVNVHRLVEAMKFGFAARTRICDPDFANHTYKISEIPTKEFAQQILKNLTDDRTHPPSYYNPIFDVKTDHGTSHTSVIDKNGMSVALTSTVNLVFGSQVLDPETGIILNDEMDDFSIPDIPNQFGLYPSPYNFPEPGKRPLSSTAPTIIENRDGTFYLAIGGSGGSRIFPAIFQVLLNLGWGLDISSAIEYGRLHDQLYPTVVDADDVYPAHLLRDLETRGHTVEVSDINRVAAVIQAVLKEGPVIYAASDSRKNGIAAGY
ncbi:gamma-glutamyltranspeptidase [Pholiota conissans]|uniref:Glutathione hydrolase n=1 Tax=Pholiota conissans TaxID=109636 RepID=A0A9P5Z2K9_9AGAR|nr:gamma-glutamyltranspeptidase [Pholiota conissans]